MRARISLGGTYGRVLRRAVPLFLPSAVVATLCCGLAYGLVQQALRQGANDPQVQMAEDATARLNAGAAPPSVVGGTPVAVASSLAPFTVVFDTSGAVLATDGNLDGGAPIPPSGVLEEARRAGIDKVSWQPRAGVRVATVTVPWKGGTVMAGRSLRLVEERETALEGIAAAAWLLALVGSAAASLLGSWLWPTGGPRG